MARQKSTTATTATASENAAVEAVAEVKATVEAPTATASATSAVTKEVLLKAAAGILTLRCHTPCQVTGYGYVDPKQTIKIPVEKFTLRVSKCFDVVSSTEKATMGANLDLESMERQDLVRIASAMGIYVSSRTPKSEIVKLIDDFRSEAVHDLATEEE